MIGANRADVMSLDGLVFVVTRATTVVEASLATIALPETEGTLHFIVARDLRRAPRLIADCDASLAQLVADGWVADLFKRYTLAQIQPCPTC